MQEQLPRTTHDSMDGEGRVKQEARTEDAKVEIAEVKKLIETIRSKIAVGVEVLKKKSS